MAVRSMSGVTFRVPVTCRACGIEALLELPIVPAVTSLLDGHAILLRSSCHSAEWPASQVELEQIRQYLHATVSVNFLHPAPAPADA